MVTGRRLRACAIAAVGALLLVCSHDKDTPNGPEALDTPDGLVADTVTATRVQLVWQAVSAAESYYVYRSTDSAGGYQLVGTVETAGFADSNLSPATTYYYTVAAVAGANVSAYSPPLAVTTSVLTPGALVVTDRTPTALTLYWSSAVPDTFYTVQRSADSGRTYDSIGTADTAVFTDTGLSPSTTYYYQVVADVGGADVVVAGPQVASTLPLPPPGDAGPVTMVVCTYSFPTADTIVINVPEQPKCDSLGQPATDPAASCRAMFRRSQDHGVDHFSAGMLALAPLVKAITAGPSFNADIGAFLDTLATMDPYIRDSIYGKFVRCSPGQGMEGMWQFDSLGPPILYFFINQDPGMQASVRAMTTDPLGRPVLFFDFDTLNQTMRAMLNRRTYGDAAVEEAIDSILYVIHTTIEYDSVWHIAGALSGDTVDVSIDSAGNMTYTHVTDTVAPHTYYLHPQAAQCPTNSLAPVWWEPNFLQLNQRP